MKGWAYKEGDFLLAMNLINKPIGVMNLVMRLRFHSHPHIEKFVSIFSLKFFLGVL